MKHDAVKFNKGDLVICIDDHLTYIQNVGHVLKKGQKYRIKHLTYFATIHGNFISYVWVDNILAPYLSERFEKIFE